MSYKFKDKQFVAVKDPSTGKMSKPRDEAYQILLDYNKELLRKDKVVKSKEVVECERVKQLVTNSALISDTWSSDDDLEWSDFVEVLDKIKKDNKNVYRDIVKAGPLFKVAIFKFFQRMYREEVQPDDFARTILMKLWKNKGSRADLKMNRFIHLKPWAPKVYEALVMKKISKRLTAHTPEFQIGGKKTYSTTEHLITIMMTMQRLQKDQGGGICMFVDIRTCFDVLQLDDALHEVPLRHSMPT